MAYFITWYPPGVCFGSTFHSFSHTFAAFPQTVDKFVCKFISTTLLRGEIGCLSHMSSLVWGVSVTVCVCGWVCARRLAHSSGSICYKRFVCLSFAVALFLSSPPGSPQPQAYPYHLPKTLLNFARYFTPHWYIHTPCLLLSISFSLSLRIVHMTQFMCGRYRNSKISQFWAV